MQMSSVHFLQDQSLGRNLAYDRINDICTDLQTMVTESKYHFKWNFLHVTVWRISLDSAEQELTFVIQTLNNPLQSLRW